MTVLLDSVLELLAASGHVSDRTYEVLLEGVHLMIVALSAQLYQPFNGVDPSAPDCPPALASLLSPGTASTNGSGSSTAAPDRRALAAAGSIESLLSWFIHRPQAPALISNPTTAAALAAQHALLQRTRSAAAAAGGSMLVAGSPMTLARMQRRWLQTIGG